MLYIYHLVRKGQRRENYCCEFKAIKRSLRELWMMDGYSDQWHYLLVALEIVARWLVQLEDYLLELFQLLLVLRRSFRNLRERPEAIPTMMSWVHPAIKGLQPFLLYFLTNQPRRHHTNIRNNSQVVICWLATTMKSSTVKQYEIASLRIHFHVIT